VVTIRTTGLPFKNYVSYPPTKYLYVSCYKFIEQTAIILLSNIRWLVSVTEDIGLLRGVGWNFVKKFE